MQLRSRLILSHCSHPTCTSRGKALIGIKLLLSSPNVPESGLMSFTVSKKIWTCDLQALRDVSKNQI